MKKATSGPKFWLFVFMAILILIWGTKRPPV
ncbi:hypothetical protein [Burkholderia phage FLC9]|nr:hypothetical protein [Burkholderia phage FLC9]